MYPYYAGPDYKCLSNMVVLAIYIFFRTAITYVFTGVIPVSLFLLATGMVLCKAAIDRGARLSTGRYGCRQ